jgi:glyoxalase family protein
MGIHHVTGIAGDAQQNVDFYAGVLGLRLVKKTINYDDPRTYHLYYGDTEGTPGSLLTFFPWPGARRGRAGVGQIAVTSLAIAPDSIGYWLHRFVTSGVDHDALTRPFGNATIAFRDRDGLLLELVATEEATVRGAWADGSVPSEHAIHGVHAVTLWEESLERTEQALVEGLGFRRADSEDQTTRFSVGDGGSGAFVDVRVVGGFLSPLGGAGTIHHVAFRARDAAEQLQLREKVTSLGLHPTPVIDRTYFQSVYVREPGNVLFEVATDGPGFTVDEPLESLGESLTLPSRLAADRASIEMILPALHRPPAPPLHETPDAPKANV